MIALVRAGVRMSASSHRFSSKATLSIIYQYLFWVWVAFSSVYKAKHALDSLFWGENCS